MSEPSCGWTPDLLLEHLRDLLHERDLRYEQRFEAQEEARKAAVSVVESAVRKAEQASERRFDSVNEFRATLSDQATHLMPRSESTQRWNSLSEKLDLLNSRLDRLEGRSSGLNAGWIYIGQGLAIIAAIIGIAIAMAN